MRAYQTKSNIGNTPDSIEVTKLGAGEVNSLATELTGSVTSSGQTPAPADGTGEVATQLSKALAIYGAGGASYHIDTGVANAYILTVVSPKESPSNYFDGFTVIFKPGNSNTTASTANVALIGTKSITFPDGTALSGGELFAEKFTKIVYNASEDRFELQDYAGSIPYDDSTASITAEDTQSAIDAIDALVVASNPFYNAYAKVSDTKSSGTSGGSFTSGDWRLRDINREDSDSKFILSISSNYITLLAGTYRCLISCPAYGVDMHKARLYNTTGSATLLVGSSEFAQRETDYESQSASLIKGRFTILTTAVLAVEHWANISQSGNGYGDGTATGLDEIYTIAEFWREA